MSYSMQNREAFEQMVVARVWKDEEFKAELYADPRGTLAKMLKEREPAAPEFPEIEIKIIDETVDHLYIVVPVAEAVDQAKVMISDEDKQYLSRKGFEAIIAARAAIDAAYRQDLVNDTRGVLLAALKELDPEITLPDNLEVTVLQETEDTAYLVIPPDPTEITDAELTEEQLEQVAGGVALVAVAVVGVVAVAGAVTAAAAVNVTAAVNLNAAVNVHTVVHLTKGAGESPW